MKKSFVLLSLLLCFSLSLFAQNNRNVFDTTKVDLNKFPDYKPIPALTQNELDSLNAVLRTNRLIHGERPRRVNNAETKHFPPVFNQDDGSCGSASNIGYMFTHEINSYRDADGSLEENMYPTHFTWLLTGHNSDKESMAVTTGIPNIITYGGRTYSQVFGRQTNETDGFGWMQGYDKWYSAMQNRASESFSLGTLEDNSEIIKNWIWNHLGDDDYHSGGIVGIGVGAYGTWAKIPAGSYEAGKSYVKYWGEEYNHALTIVGYDDDIEIDLNENGNIEDDEKGAWIVVNSWGDGWEDKGFIYCPYKNSRSTYDPTTKQWGGKIGSGGYRIRKNYHPLRTIKISMNYSRRNEIGLSAGIAQDTSATTPEQSISFDHFRYGGGACPMLGKWKDGWHEESMEFGYDLTDLSASFDQTKPLKYFFIVNTAAAAIGTGVIDSCAIINYEFDKLGIETPFSSKNVTVKNAGKQTIISVIVSGESINPPLNLALEEKSEKEVFLSWNAPRKSNFELTSYQIFRDGEFLVSIPANQTSYTDGNSYKPTYYQVNAIYSKDGSTYESIKTEYAIRTIDVEKETSILFTNSGFSIPDVFNQSLSQFTIEFLAKPTSVYSYNWHIGPQWGKFLFHFNNGNTMTVGYTTSERMNGVSNITAGTWAHIAVVVKNDSILLYKDGLIRSRAKYNGRNGVSNIKNFIVGNISLGGGIDGEIDEFRIWKTARTAKEVKTYKRCDILNIKAEEDLLAYYKMDTINGKLRDSKGFHHAEFVNSNYVVKDQTAFKVTDVEETPIIADFEIPANNLYVGMEIKLANKTTKNATSYIWNAKEAGIENKELANPSLIYKAPGTYTITLTAKNDKNSNEVSKQITIEPLPLPKADFQPAFTATSVGKRISFINKTMGNLCEYKWIFEGGTPSEATTVDAVTTYNKFGKYTVKLIAKNSSGENIIVKEKVIEVKRIVPVADFDANKLNVTVNEEIQLIDKSDFDPSEWRWTVEDEQTKTYTEQNPIVKFAKPGHYSIKLVAINEAGKDSVSKEKYITVFAPGAGNALSFDGSDDYVQINNIFNETKQKEFTVEWWMYSNQNSDEGQQMGDKWGTFFFQSSTSGILKAGFNSSNSLYANAVIEEGTWNHIAFVFDNGRATIYKNGKKMTSKTFAMKEAPLWENGFRIGCDNGKTINGSVDEFRIWNVARTQDQIVSTINTSIENPTLIPELEVYYQFNQSTGDVIDALNKHVGKRVNFGPDGDAWSQSNAFNACVDASKISVEIQRDVQTNALINFEIGSGIKRAIFIKKTSEYNGLPTDGVKYEASADLQNPGTFIENSGYTCVMNGAKAYVSLVGLEPLTNYDVLIVEYAENSNLPVYFKTCAKATFTTGIGTNDQTYDLTIQSVVYQSASTIEIKTTNWGKHSVKLYNTMGTLLYETIEDSNYFIIDKKSMTDAMYIIVIDETERFKVPIVK